MSQVTFLFGLFALLITSALLYYTVRVLLAFHHDRKLAATNFVLKDDVPEAFRALSVTGAIFSVLAFIGFISLLFRDIDLAFLMETGGTFLIIGFTIFMKRISDSMKTPRRE